MGLVRYSKSSADLRELRNLLRNSKVVAAPTETAYGLLADATSRRAVSKVVSIKGRELGKPIALVAAGIPMVSKYFKLSAHERLVAKNFWPGALTLLLLPRNKFPSQLKGQDGRIGVRVPKSAWLRKLVGTANMPLTATSANRAGAPTPYSAAAVARQLGARGLKNLVDGGRLRPRPTSTVMRISGRRLIIIRDGAISRARLERVLRSTV